MKTLVLALLGTLLITGCLMNRGQEALIVEILENTPSDDAVAWDDLDREDRPRRLSVLVAEALQKAEAVGRGASIANMPCGVATGEVTGIRKALDANATAGHESSVLIWSQGWLLEARVAYYSHDEHCP